MKAQPLQMANQNRLEIEPICTSLFDLIVALQDEICSSEDWIIAVVITHMFETGQVKFFENNKHDDVP